MNGLSGITDSATIVIFYTNDIIIRVLGGLCTTDFN